MECSRKECDSILCQSYSQQYGYCCYECLSEMKEAQLTDPEFSIIKFMNTAKVVTVDDANVDLSTVFINRE